MLVSYLVGEVVALPRVIPGEATPQDVASQLGRQAVHLVQPAYLALVVVAKGHTYDGLLVLQHLIDALLVALRVRRGEIHG